MLTTNPATHFSLGKIGLRIHVPSQHLQNQKYVKLGRLAFWRAMSAVHLRGSWHRDFPSASPRFHCSAKKNRRQGHFIKQSNVAHPNKVITCILDKSSHPYLSVQRFFCLSSCYWLLIHCPGVHLVKYCTHSALCAEQMGEGWRAGAGTRYT